MLVRNPLLHVHLLHASLEALYGIEGETFETVLILGSQLFQKGQIVVPLLDYSVVFLEFEATAGLDDVAHGFEKFVIIIITSV